MSDPLVPAGGLVRARAMVAMVLGLGALAVMCLLWSPLALLLERVLPLQRRRQLGRRVISAGARRYLSWLQWACGCRFELDTLEGLALEGPMVVAANHPSLLDAVLLLAYLPNAVCVMKSSLSFSPLFGPAARLAGYVPNRDALEMVLKAREVLDDGAQLIIFPEGTRTVMTPLNALQAGAGMIAAKSRVPVQMLIFEYSSPYLGKTWPLLRPPELPLSVKLRRSARFEAPEQAAALTAAMEARFKRELGHAPGPGVFPVGVRAG